MINRFNNTVETRVRTIVQKTDSPIVDTIGQKSKLSVDAIAER